MEAVAVRTGLRDMTYRTSLYPIAALPTVFCLKCLGAQVWCLIFLEACTNSTRFNAGIGADSLLAIELLDHDRGSHEKITDDGVN